MNVLMVDQYGQTGGAQKCLLDLIADWPRDGNLVVAAPENGTLLRSVRDAGFIAEAIPSGPYAAGRGRVFDALRFCNDAMRQRAILRGLIGRLAIDVVYVNGPRVLLGATLAARGRCPVVFHAHNHVPTWPWCGSRCGDARPRRSHAASTRGGGCMGRLSRTVCPMRVFDRGDIHPKGHGESALLDASRRRRVTFC